ncbi:MAG: DUF89 family protein [Helicobacteraceae bacterium]|nr:DUF89 family protein [Helicobacteraceae bacterium]
MNIQQECIECLINQAQRVSTSINASDELSKELISSVSEASKNFSFNQSPPEIASSLYENMATIANRSDLYKKQKEDATKLASKLLPTLKEKLLNSQNLLLDATKISVAGNVIDLATTVMFDLEDQLEEIFDVDFAYDDFEELKNSLQTSSTLLFIGDNVGEHIFDYLYIEKIQELFPKLEISYMVRGNPIINDVTMKEAKEIGFDKLCSLVDSGVNTPGFAYDRANKFSKDLFDSADMVITKGMGNFECLSEAHRKNLFFLFKVKCNVVASCVGKSLGDLICKKI